MHDNQRLRLEHLYQDPIPRPKLYHYDLTHQQPIVPLNHSLRIQTHKINLFSDYDLPLKQLQFTQTRQYKQNLNPIFQQLSTTHDRYSYSREWNKKTKNDDLPVSDRYYANEIKRPIQRKDNKEKRPKKQQTKNDVISRQDKVKVKQLREKSRILSEKIKRVQKGQVLQLWGNQSVIRKQRKNRKGIQPEQDRQWRIGEKMDEQDRVQLTSQSLAEVYLQKMRCKTQQLEQCVKESQQKVRMLRKQVSMHKQKCLIKQRQLFYLQQQKNRIMLKSSKLEQCLQDYSSAYVQTQTKHNQLSKKVRIKKQQLKKQQNWLQQQKKQIKSIDNKIQQLLKLLRHAQEQQDKQQEFISQFHQQQQLNQQLKHSLTQTQSIIDSLTKQTQLVQEQTNTLQMHLDQLKDLQQKFLQQTFPLESTLHQLTQQITQKDQFIQQQPQIDQLIRQVQLEIGQISQKKIIIQQHIHEVNLKISLKNRNINYIQQHFSNKDSNNTSTKQFLDKPYPNPSYQPIRNAQFTIGHQQHSPIYRGHHDHQFKYNNQFSFTSLGNYHLNLNNHKPTLTNNHNLNNNHPIKPFSRNSSNNNTQINNNSIKPFSSYYNTTHHSNPHKQPLPTIRQHSNNTSAYQSPKVSQEFHQPQQQSPKLYHELKQQPISHLQSQSLQIDSRMLSQTEILKPHHNYQSSPHQKPKKYFVIESQDDAALTNSKSAFAHAKSYLQHNKPFDSHYQNRSQQIFIQRQNKPSIQHRINDDMEHSVLRSEQQLQHEYQEEEQKNKKSFSAELQSSNYQQSAKMNRLQSQQSQFPIVKLPPKSNDQKHTKRQQISQRVKDKAKPKTMRNSNNTNKYIKNDSENESIQQSEDVFESLIEQYQQIKSNSCFQESWKHKI